MGAYLWQMSLGFCVKLARLDLPWTKGAGYDSVATNAALITKRN
jgi:hypothetical protein